MQRLTAVAEILQEADESVDIDDFDGSPISWIELMEKKVSPEMIRLLQTEGQLRPIHYKDEMIGNGHHRLVSVILLGWDYTLTDDDPEDVGYIDTTYDPKGWECEDVHDNPDDPDTILILSGLWETLRDLVQNDD